MQKKKTVFFAAAPILLVISLFVNTSLVFGYSGVLKEGTSGSGVTKLQKDLKELGYFSVEPTGYYGSITKSAVHRLQGRYGLMQDGIAGPNTFSLIRNLFQSSAPTRSASNILLKEGMTGDNVTLLQQDLKALGYLKVNPTGYFGVLTKKAVESLQADHGLLKDGIAGAQTFAVIDGLTGRRETDSQAGTATRGNSGSIDYMISWFGNAENIFSIGSIAQVYDVKTGRIFNIKRTYGYNHADCETLTAGDTKTMLEIYGGSWGGERRPIILTVNGRKMAASMAGVPHAGLDRFAANAYLNSRSGGYGAGYNLDAVKNNNMDGVFDIHFLNSRTHGTNRVDPEHQNALKEAASWAKRKGF